MNEHVAAKAGRATYQDVLDAPEHMVAELDPRARCTCSRGRRSRMRGRRRCLAIEIGGPFDPGRGGPGGWWIVDEPELHFGEDVAGRPTSRAGGGSGCRPSRPRPWLELAPDWVCEVLSPSTRRIDLTDKREIYGEAGVGHLWLVDPIDRTLEVFARRDGAWVLDAALADEAEVQAPPFEAVGFPLSALWIEAS